MPGKTGKYLNVLLILAGSLPALQDFGARFAPARAALSRLALLQAQGFCRPRGSGRSSGEILRARLLDCRPGDDGFKFQVVCPDPSPFHWHPSHALPAQPSAKLSALLHFFCFADKVKK